MRAVRASLCALVLALALAPAGAEPSTAAECSGVAPQDAGCTVKFPAPSALSQVNIASQTFVGTVFARVTSEMTGAFAQESCSLKAAPGKPVGSQVPQAGIVCTWARDGVFMTGEELTLTVTTALFGPGTPGVGSWSVTAG